MALSSCTAGDAMIATHKSAPSPDPLPGKPEAETGQLSSITSLEALLEELEGSIGQQGLATLFLGEQRRLWIFLHRPEGETLLRWGLRVHEGWAFKATLLRFARGTDPVHLLAESGQDGAEGTWLWVVRRSMESFWASPLSREQAHVFRDRHRGH